MDAVARQSEDRFLVYYNFGGSPAYIPILKLSVESLRKYNGNADVDVVIFCDDFAVAAFADVAADCNARIHSLPNAATMFDVLYRRLHIFNYVKELRDYDVVLHLDADTLIYTDIPALLRKCRDETVLYVCTEDEDYGHDNHTNYFFSLQNYTEQQLAHFRTTGTYTFNAGVFAFRPSAVMREHFNNVLVMIKEHTGDRARVTMEVPDEWRVDAPFTDQAFMNVYFNLMGATNREVLTRANYIMWPRRHVIYDDAIVHFLGNMGNGEHKLSVMQEYIEEISKQKLNSA